MTGSVVSGPLVGGALGPLSGPRGSGGGARSSRCGGGCDGFFRVSAGFAIT